MNRAAASTGTTHPPNNNYYCIVNLVIELVCSSKGVGYGR
jgi:hypothetical protein